MVLERDICKVCGNPVWLCHTANSSVQFDIKSNWCFGKAELEDYESGPNVPKLEPGESRYAVAVGLLDENGNREPLPSRREALAQIAIVTRKESD